MPLAKNGMGLARVALLESRMRAELSSLVRKHGGVPVCVAAVNERPADSAAQVAAFIDGMVGGGIDAAVLQTGVSVDELARVAASLGRSADLAAGLRRVTKVCRGPKPVAALRRLGLSADVLVPEPYTTAEMISTLGAMPLCGAIVAVVHHGERNLPLVEAIKSRAHAVEELFLYRWELPEDTAPLRQLVADIINGAYDAVAFTSQAQARHLFLVAREVGCEQELARSLQSGVVTAAVGPTCAAELESHGVTPHVVPEHPKMGHMALALAAYMRGRASVDLCAAERPWLSVF